MFNVLNQELPAERRSRYWAFIGARRGVRELSSSCPDVGRAETDMQHRGHAACSAGATGKRGNVSDYLTALALAALPAFANFGGGVLAEAFRVSSKALSLALHLAAGIVLAVVAVELIPEALSVDTPWVPIVAFVLGGGFYLAVDSGIERLTSGRGSGPFVIFFGVAVDLFSDGIMIGTGTSIEFGLGLLLALGQTPADVPEGFAAIATFKNAGVSRRNRFLLSAAFALPIMLGVTLGYWGVRGQSELVKFSLLAVTAGVLTTVVVEEIVPESHKEGPESRLATAFFIGGFALFALLAEYLG